MSRKSSPQPTAREITTAIRQGERAGKTQREIAAALGINERTVRKIKSGQTSGTRTTARLKRRPLRAGATPNAMNAEFVIGIDANGNPIVASANIIATDVRTAQGTRRAPTALDVFRMPTLGAVVEQERRRLARQYASSLRPREGEDICARRTCQHPADDHIGGASVDTEIGGDDLYPCLVCPCRDFLDAPITVRLRSISTMRKPAAAIIRTGSPS